MRCGIETRHPPVSRNSPRATLFVTLASERIRVADGAVHDPPRDYVTWRARWCACLRPLPDASTRRWRQWAKLKATGETWWLGHGHGLYDAPQEDY